MNYLTIVSELTGIAVKKILSKSRKGKICEARQLCMYFYTIDFGLSEAGRILIKDHSSVYHGHKKIIELLEIKDKRTVKIVNDIKNEMANRKEINL